MSPRVLITLSSLHILLLTATSAGTPRPSAYLQLFGAVSAQGLQTRAAGPLPDPPVLSPRPHCLGCTASLAPGFLCLRLHLSCCSGTSFQSCCAGAYVTGLLINPLLSLSLYYFFNVYLFLRDRERQSTSRAGAEKETQNLKQAPGSELSAWSPMRGLNSPTVGS